jgi:nitroreductase
MSVYDTIRTMLAVREYDDRPIPEEIVQRIVEAGRLTGSSMNGQPHGGT